MNRQSRKTRQAIFVAFTGLLNQKRYSAITMQEIADRADVGRSTVYSHFETKEDILTAMCRQLFEEMFVTGHPLPDSPESMLMTLLEHIRQNEKVIAGLFSSEGMELFVEFCRQQLLGMIAAQLLTGYDDSSSRLPRDFLLNHLAGTILEAIIWWTKNRMEPSSEQMVQYLMAVIRPILDSPATG